MGDQIEFDMEHQSKAVLRWKRAINGIRTKMRRNDFAGVVLDLIEKLESEQATKFIKKLIEDEFKSFSSRLDKQKPLVLIITTHGKGIYREVSSFSKVRKLAQQIKERIKKTKKTIKKKFLQKTKKTKRLLVNLLNKLKSTVKSELHKIFFKQDEEDENTDEEDENTDEESENMGEESENMGEESESEGDGMEEEEKVRVTYIKGNAEGLCQQFSIYEAGKIQKDISDWFKNGIFDKKSILQISKKVKNTQFAEYNENIINAIKSDTLPMWRMKYGTDWKVGSQEFSSTENFEVKSEFNKKFYLRIDEVSQYNYTDMLIHTLDKDGDLMPIPWLFSDVAHLFGGAVTVGTRRVISYGKVLEISSKFNKEIISFEFACDNYDNHLNEMQNPPLVSLNVLGGNNKKRKTRKYKKRKTRKCNP